MKIAYFSLGCFWGPQLEFEKIKGVKKIIRIIPSHRISSHITTKRIAKAIDANISTRFDSFRFIN